MTCKSFLFHCIPFFPFSLSFSVSLSPLFFCSLRLLFLSLLPTQILKSIRYAFDWYTVCTAITACTGRVCTIHPHLRLPPQSSHATIPILPIILPLLPLRMHARTAAAAVASCNRHEGMSRGANC